MKKMKIVLSRTGKIDPRSHTDIFKVIKTFNVMKPLPDDMLSLSEVQQLQNGRSIEVEIDCRKR